ncbi:Uncharacterised protein [Mycobacteroides abscessus subsp. abscessus]|nr:Uncharacterised protein [Mycobacteroides abscessus subsp. abscessus]
MNSSPSDTKPRSPVLSQGPSGVPADGSAICAPKHRCSSGDLRQ